MVTGDEAEGMITFEGAVGGFVALRSTTLGLGDDASTFDNGVVLIVSCSDDLLLVFLRCLCSL